MQIEDHPHACGDKSNDDEYAVAQAGSSPRVWGQGIYNGLMKPYERIIPTRVGTRVISKYQLLAEGDHPHACGDKSPHQQMVTQKPGSSPRVWGQDFKLDMSIRSIRIIPTRVGTSRSNLL